MKLKMVADRKSFFMCYDAKLINVCPPTEFSSSRIHGDKLMITMPQVDGEWDKMKAKIEETFSGFITVCLYDENDYNIYNDHFLGVKWASTMYHANLLDDTKMVELGYTYHTRIRTKKEGKLEKNEIFNAVQQAAS